MRSVTLGSCVVASLVIAMLGSTGSTDGDAEAAPRRSPACDTPDHRAFDFWIGDWDVHVRARQSATGPWGESVGKQHVEAVLDGCAISESFTADGPGTPWAGRSYSAWHAPAKKWRQTWVDDQGSYLAFTGGVENGSMTLYGEPRTSKDPKTAGKTIQMRMVFSKVTPTSLHWEWQQTLDNWKTSTAMMEIEYTRRAR